MYSNHGWSYSTVRQKGRVSRRHHRKPGFHLGWILGLAPLLAALVLIGLLAWYEYLFEGFTHRGQVTDETTGAPVVGARVWTSKRTARTNESGEYVLEGVKPPETVSFSAAGYGGASARLSFPPEPVAASLEPVQVDLVVMDLDTGELLPHAEVTAGELALQPLSEGRFRLSPAVPLTRVQVGASGYLPDELVLEESVSSGDTHEVALAPKLVGRVTDSTTGLPIPGVRLTIDGAVLETDQSGDYALTRRPVDPVATALMPGYYKATVNYSNQRGWDIQLLRNEVKALYLTYFAVGHPDFLRRMFTLLDTTELNAVVLDVKGDPGLLSYRSRVPLAEQIGANDHPTIDNLDALLQSLRDRGVYTIARIVVFKDDQLSRNGHRAGLDVAIKDRATGGPWIDGEDLGWVDPFQQAAWDYNIELAVEAIERGFDEVQFDYIRFPTDPAAGRSISDAVYSRDVTRQSREQALATFLGRAREAVNRAGGFLGIDTFGYTTYWDHDGGIGQNLAVLANHVDYLSPMIYPSTYSAGLPGSFNFPEVVRRPYEVVYESLVAARPKVEGKRVVLRPWLQYFDDYPWATGYRYDAPQIEAQKKAVVDAGALGWMLWDEFNLYDRGGLAPER